MHKSIVATSQALASAALLCCATMFAAGCAVSPSGKSALVAIPGTEDARIALYLADIPPTAHIYSDSGIGSAQLWFAGGIVPAGFTLRLHLSGLEALLLNCDGREVRVSVMSHGDHAVREWRASPEGGVDTPLQVGDDAWAAVAVSYGEQAGENDSRPAYFDIELPAAFVATGCSLLRVEWIDFYR